MACQTCRSHCGDCSEGGITFKRVRRTPVPDHPPQTPATADQRKMLSLLEHKVQVLSGLEAKK